MLLNLMTGLLLSLFTLATPTEAIPEVPGSDFKVLSDKTENGIRKVTAQTSELVCSSSIYIEINVKDKTIQKCRYTHGCQGNLKGIGTLVVGMKVPDVIKKLEGVNCGNKGTSCPDQLARVLKSLNW